LELAGVFQALDEGCFRAGYPDLVIVHDDAIDVKPQVGFS